jgi:hypothetical protein
MKHTNYTKTINRRSYLASPTHFHYEWVFVGSFVFKSIKEITKRDLSPTLDRYDQPIIHNYTDYKTSRQRIGIYNKQQADKFIKKK